MRYLELDRYLWRIFKKNKESRQGDRLLCTHLQKRTKGCKQAGHDPASEFFDYYEEQDDNVLAFHGKTMFSQISLPLIST